MTQSSDLRLLAILILEGTHTSEEHHGLLRPIRIIEPVEQSCHLQGSFSLDDWYETKSERVAPVDEVHKGYRDKSERVGVRDIKGSDNVENVLLNAMELPGVHWAKKLRGNRMSSRRQFSFLARPPSVCCRSTVRTFDPSRDCSTI